MNIFFSGIGGVALGPLAQIAHDAGYTVLGSDVAESLTTKELTSRGITVRIGQDSELLEAEHALNPIDWLVYTAALPNDHPELLAARKLGIKTSKRDELLSHILNEKKLKLLAVSGTHGKTTTTGMLVWALKEIGVPISYSVGSTISFGPSGHYDPESEYFVYECDEFDRNFLHFSPHLSIVTSIGYDHSDTYPTKADYAAAFRQFIYQSKFAILWQRDSDSISARYPDSWCLQNDEVIDSLSLPGVHNRRNATLVLKALEKLAIGENQTNRTVIEQFPGTNRRFEKVAENLYSDYGHHPTEIAATLQMARELSDKVVLVYQPHQNVRQHEIKSLYRNCFTDAAVVYWLPTYLSREDTSLSILTPDELVHNIANRGSIHIAEMNDELWTVIEKHRADGQLVLCMGAGSVDSWVRGQLLD
ncbi:MAG: Mur ligase domain-containing protein [Candidatus Saccharimonadales bacterium]